MNILILKLFSLLLRVKDSLQIHLLQYAISTYKSRPIVNNKAFDNQTLEYLNKAIFALYFVLRLLVLGIIYLLKLIKAIILPRNQGLAGMLFSLVKILILLFPLTLTGIYWYLSGDAKPAQLQFYQELHRYRTATAISDSHGNLIGAIANPLTPPIENISQTPLPATLFVNKPPDVFWELIKAQEDKDLSFDYADTGLMDVLLLKKRTYKGLHLVDVVKKYIGFFIPRSSSPRQGLITQIVNNLYGEKYFEEKCSIKSLKKLNIGFLNALNRGITGLCKTTKEIHAARHLFPYLAKYQGLEFKRWAAMYTPPLTADQNIQGIRAVSEIIFGKAPSALSEAQQALLAAAYLHKIQFIAASDNKQNQQRVENWQKLVKSAINDIEITYAENQPEKANKLIQDLKQFTIPIQATIPAQFKKHIENLNISQQRKYSNLMNRSDLFVHGFTDLLKQRLRNIYARLNKNQAVSDMIITLPSLANINLEKDINRAMQSVIQNCPSCFNVLPGKPVENNGALMQIIVSDEQGKVVRLYKRGNVSTRSIASISMLPASILLTSMGIKAKTRFCDLEYRGVKNTTQALNFSAKSCRKLLKRGRAHSFKDIIAASKSLPLFYALMRSYHPTKDQLIALYKNFKLKFPDNIQGESLAERLSIDLSFGNAQSNLQNVHKLAHKITQTLYNSEFETDPYMVDQYLVADSKQSIETYISGALVSRNTVQSYLKRSSTKKELRKILQAPVYSPSGTLRSFQNIPSVRFLFAKSGIVLTPTKSVKDKWTVGGFKVNGKKYTFLIFVGTDSKNNKGLGNRISHRMLIYPIMNAVIRSLR